MKTKSRYDFVKHIKGGEVKNSGYMELSETTAGNAYLYFYGDIVSEEWETERYEEGKCPKDIVEFLKQIDPQQEIEIHFNSAGGSAYAGIAIHNLLKRHTGMKIGYVDSIAASIASVILCACDEIHMPIASQILIHKPMCAAWGNANQFLETIEMLNKCEQMMTDIYMQKTKEGVSREKITELLAEGKWMDRNEASQYFNMVFEENEAIAACTSEWYERYKKKPEKTLQDTAKNTDEQEAEEILQDLYLYGIGA